MVRLRARLLLCRSDTWAAPLAKADKQLRRQDEQREQYDSFVQPPTSAPGCSLHGVLHVFTCHMASQGASRSSRRRSRSTRWWKG